MISLPKRIPVFAEWYTIRRPVKVAEDAWGDCNYEQKVIKIQRKMPNDMSLIITYLHEVIHAVTHEAHIREIDGDRNDDNVDRLAHGIAQAVRALVEAA